MEHDKLCTRKFIDCSRFEAISLSFLTFCLLFTTISSHSFASSQGDAIPTNEEELYQLCRSTYAAGKFIDANQHIEKFLSLYTESKYNIEILFMRAFLQFAIDASAKIYGLIIENYPNSDWAAKSHFQLGQSYYLQDEYDKALDHYGKIIISYPESEEYWPALYWKCKSLMAKDEYQEAVPVLISLKSIDSDQISRDMVLMSLGNCYRGIKDHENAEASYRTLIDSVPDSQWIPSAYLLLARSLQDRGNIEEAEAIYKKVTEDFGQSMEAQRAQDYLNSLSSSATESVSDQPVVPESTETTQVSPERKEAYFTIQVGAFTNKRNAEKLANQLKKKGYSVRIVPPVPGRSRLHKVRIGTFETRKDASETARKFSRNERLDTEVIYQPAASD